MTADTHPMHVHLVQFQVVHRRPAGSTAAGVADGTGVLPFEKGWKDTVSAHPGLTTRIRMKFDVPPGSADRPAERPRARRDVPQPTTSRGPTTSGPTSTTATSSSTRTTT